MLVPQTPLSRTVAPYSTGTPGQDGAETRTPPPFIPDTNIVDCDVEAVTVGMAVRVVFDPAGDSDALFRFAPA